MALADKILEEAKKKEKEELFRKYHETQQNIGNMEKEAAGDIAKEALESAKVDEQFNKALTAASSKTATPED